MENEKDFLVEKFNRGELTPPEFDRLEELFVAGEIDIEALECFGRFEKKTAPLPFNLEKIDANFYELLRHQVDRMEPQPERRKFRLLSPILTYALPVFTLLIGLIVGHYWEGHGSLQESNLENQPGTVAVQFLNRFFNDPLVTNRVEALTRLQNTRGDQNQIDLLFFSLNNDRSTIVRLEALDALLHHSHRLPIRQRLLDALKRQESPYLVQYLSEALRQMGAPMTQEQFRQLLHHNIPSEAVVVMESNLRTF